MLLLLLDHCCCVAIAVAFAGAVAASGKGKGKGKAKDAGADTAVGEGEGVGNHAWVLSTCRVHMCIDCMIDCVAPHRGGIAAQWRRRIPGR